MPFNLCHVEVKFYWQKTEDDIAIACREGKEQEVSNCNAYPYRGERIS